MKFWSVITLCVFFFAPVSTEASGQKRVWQSVSNPDRFNVGERTFSALPLSGQAANTRRFWSSDYWSKRKGGINYRWNTARPVGQNLRSPSREQVMTMTQEQLATLAPSEKLDLLAGAYDYPLKREIARYANPDAPEWEGICNGWAEASTHHDEPNPITLANPDGLQIPFGSSDIKALLSWYYFREDNHGYARMGNRCRGGWGSDCAHDLNAGAFHLVVANTLGLKGEGFTADMDRGKEVWNHTATSYTSQIVPGRARRMVNPTRGTVRQVRVRTVVYYTFVLKKNSWEPVLGTPEQKSTPRTYEYYLDLNGQGQVIGGEWISEQRPDFLWRTDRLPEFTGNMAALGTIVNALGI